MAKKRSGGGGSEGAIIRWFWFGLALAGLAIVGSLLSHTSLNRALENGAAGIRNGVGVDKDNSELADGLLPTLRVADRGPGAGYNRETSAQWGTPWYDQDDNGCDTRDDILRRDLGNPLPADPDGPKGPKTAPCKVTGGRLVDPYRGTVVNFNPKDPAAVQIDHVVALKEAWRTGAAGWTAKQRRAFANDPLELQASARSVNESKSDTGADGWKPPRDRQCAFAVLVVRIKAKYNLTVTPAEVNSLKSMLQTCG